MNELFATLRTHRLHEPKHWLERLVVLGGAACSSLLIIFFTHLSEFASRVFHGALQQAWWSPLLITPLGGVVVVYAVRRWFAGAAGSGIPQVIAALHEDRHNKPINRLLSIRIALGKVFLGSTVVGLGFSTGREGPSVQVGASIMSVFYRFLPDGHQVNRRHMILAGGAAGIAAAFNTPLAGIVFAIEELSRSFEQATNGLLLAAIVLAGMVSISFEGNYLYFGHLSVTGIDHHIIIPVLTCGLVCGTVGGIFSRILLWSARPRSSWLGRLRSSYPLGFAALCGLGVALLGLITHGTVHGSGYSVSRELLSGSGTVSPLFVPAKCFTTLLSYFSGVPGGIFAPSLAIGAGIGRDLIPLFGTNVSHAGIYALCMAGFLAAVTQAPITSSIIVMEMIDGHEMVISLIAVTLLGTLVARLLSPGLYHTLAENMVTPATAPDEPVPHAAPSASTPPPDRA